MAETPKLTLEQCKEVLGNASGTISTALATLMLACQLQVADAQNTTQVAMNAQAPTPTVSVKGVVVGQIASNGEDFSLVKTVEEGKQRVKDGKWTEDDYDNFLDFRDKARKQAAIADQTRIDSKKQAAIADQTRIDSKKQAAIKEASDWWKKIQPTLATLPQDKVITFLKKDKEGYEKLLKFIVDNDIPPPGYANQLLSLLKSA